MTTASRIRWAAMAAAVLPWMTGSARADATAWAGDTHAAVRLITASEVAPGAKTLGAGLEFRFAPGWHGYWRTPGDAGLPPMVDWSASGNVVTSELSWPAPTRLVVEGLQNSVYTGQFVLPSTLRLGTPGAPVDIKVSVGFAACAKICVPYSVNLDLTVPRGGDGLSAEASLIAAASANVPGEPAKAGFTLVGSAIEASGSTRHLVVDLRSDDEPFRNPDLFIEGAEDGLPAAPVVTLSEGGHAARLRTQLSDDRIAGPLTATLVDGARRAEFMVGPERSALPGAPGWLLILATSLLGGAVLNLMPCVLPVLSIKLLALTRHAGQERRTIRLAFLTTAVGNVACLLMLAVVLAGLQQSGMSLGWGVQFQQPLFLAGMALVTTFFAASFFEWLPIGLPGWLMVLDRDRSRGELAEAFLTGMLAALLATPCSAPFVGTAVGFALARGPMEIVVIFLCLGIGMAFPYWMVAMVPDVVRWLPKPGAWMMTLRKALGLILLGTTVWLLGVLAGAAGWETSVTTAAFLGLLLAHRGWLHLRPDANSSHSGPLITGAIAAASLTAAAFVPGSAAPSAREAGWQAFDPAAIRAFVFDGKTVFVDVTARWCLTCQVNELAALDRPNVRRRLDMTNVVRMRADWSWPDARISAYLKGFGRYGIPLDVVYGPGQPRGEALPELLTPTLVLDSIDRAASVAPAASASSR